MSLLPEVVPRLETGSRWRLPLPGPLRHIADELEERAARLPTEVNEYGVDPFGASPAVLQARSAYLLVTARR